MSRSAAVASSLLRRLAAASSRPPVLARSISAGPAEPLRPFIPAGTPRALSPLLSPSRGFARGRRESVTSKEVDDDDDEEEEQPMDELGVWSEMEVFGSDLTEWSDDVESVDELKDESD